MTYESASEAEVLKSFWRNGAPLENTIFAILDPHGRAITRGGRSPDWLFRDSADMANSMYEIARYYQSNSSPRYLPVVSSVRLGMNVAACDKLPIAIILGDTEQERQYMQSALAPLSWSNNFIGKFTYAAGRRSDLNNIQGSRIAKGYLFVSPNEFGTGGTVIAQLYPNASTTDLGAAMKATMQRHNPMLLDHREHIRWGREQGISWQSAIPVTDPHQLQAEQMERWHQPRGWAGR